MQQPRQDKVDPMYGTAAGFRLYVRAVWLG